MVANATKYTKRTTEKATVAEVYGIAGDIGGQAVRIARLAFWCSVIALGVSAVALIVTMVR